MILKSMSAFCEMPALVPFFYLAGRTQEKWSRVYSWVSQSQEDRTCFCMVVQIMHGNYLRDVLLNPQLWPAEKSYSKEGTRCWATSFCFIMQIAKDRYFYCSWNVQLYSPVLYPWDDSCKHQNRRPAKHSASWPSVLPSLSGCVSSEVQGLICISTEGHRGAQLQVPAKVGAVHC